MSSMVKPAILSLLVTVCMLCAGRLTGLHLSLFAVPFFHEHHPCSYARSAFANPMARHS